MISGTTARLHLVLLLALTSAGCQIVEGIFQVGLWAGVVLVLVILAVVAFAVRSFRRRRPRV